MVVAKFQINRVSHGMGGHQDGPRWIAHPISTVEMNVVTGGSEENKKFFASTPGGSIMLSGLGPEIAALFPVGKPVYVNFVIEE